MKRFLLFAWYHYYPEGGCHDLIDSFDTLEEAKAQGDICMGPHDCDIPNTGLQDYHVLDTHTGEIIA